MIEVSPQADKCINVLFYNCVRVFVCFLFRAEKHSAQIELGWGGAVSMGGDYELYQLDQRFQTTCNGELRASLHQLC